MVRLFDILKKKTHGCFVIKLKYKIEILSHSFKNVIKDKKNCLKYNEIHNYCQKLCLGGWWMSGNQRD